MFDGADIAPDQLARQPWLSHRGRQAPLTKADRVWMGATAPAVALAAGVRQFAYRPIAPAVMRAARGLEDLTDDALAARAKDWGRGARKDEPARLRMAAPIFALIREAAWRTLSKRHYPVQLMGGWALMRGRLVEMATGEGKTLTVTLAAAAMALTGRPVHVVTVNDYLARRDHDEMAPLYRLLGLSTGLVVEDMSPQQRRAAYDADITYCTNTELAFDYLKARADAPPQSGAIAARVDAAYGAQTASVQRGFAFAIIDEADSVLLDEARTPLILSQEGPANFDPALLAAAWSMIEALSPQHYEIDWARRNIALTSAGERRLAAHVGEGGLLANRVIREELAVKALTARHLFKRDEHYLLRDGKVVIVDEYTGRQMPDRFWTDGLHQLIELKERAEPSGGRVTIARTTYQRFFPQFDRVGGLTGTAQEVSGEMWRTYGLATVAIPTHRRRRRREDPPRVFRRSARKWRVIAALAERLTRRNLPVLIGTRSVDASAVASAALSARGLSHRVLSAAQDQEEAAIIATAGEPGQITIATNMAGRGADIALGEGVAARGGLQVIMSERHDSRRIDRQLAGRAGRRGEPGRFRALVSLEDALVVEHAGAVALWLARIAPHPGLRRWVVRRAQARAEALHARMRRDLRQQDEVMLDAMSFAGAPN